MKPVVSVRVENWANSWNGGWTSTRCSHFGFYFKTFSVSIFSLGNYFRGNQPLRWFGVSLREATSTRVLHREPDTTGINGMCCTGAGQHRFSRVEPAIAWECSLREPTSTGFLQREPATNGNWRVSFSFFLVGADLPVTPHDNIDATHILDQHIKCACLDAGREHCVL